MARRFGHLAARAISIVLSLVLSTGPVLAQAAPAFASQPSLAADIGAAGSDESSPSVVSEIESKRTRTSKTYRLSDGSKRVVVSSGPVHFKEHDEWHDIETDLIPSAVPGEVHTKQTKDEITFRGQSAGKRPVRVAGDGWSVELDMLGVAEGAKLVYDNKARYLGVAEDTDLLYEAVDDGLKETLVLGSSAAPSSFAFAMALDGVELRTQPGGGSALYRPGADTPELEVGVLRVWDSSQDAAGNAAECAEATMSLSVSSDGRTAYAHYELPRSWLDDPARVYPIYVDPTLTLSENFDTTIHSIGNTDYHGSFGELCTGYWSSTGHHFSMVRFEVPDLTGARVDSATYSVYCHALQTASVTYLGRNTSYWSESWRYSDGRPTYNQIGSQTVSGTGWVNWAVTSTVSDWANRIGAAYWYGFQMYQSTSQGENYFKKFWSSDYSTSSLRPKLVINYTDPAPITTLSGTNSGLEWWRAKSGSTPVNDLARVGRGAVGLTWAANARADGYKVYMSDTYTNQLIADLPGSGNTSFSTEGMGIYPSDSQIAALPTNYTGNALFRSQMPGAAGYESAGNVTLPAGDYGTGTNASAGVVTTDGKFLYVRGFQSAYGGPKAWAKVGTGFGGTTRGQLYGLVGPEFPTKSVMSGFLVDGFLYNGYADTANSITGVWSGADGDDTDTTSLAFTNTDGSAKPLLDKYSGSALTGASPNVLLTSDANYVYSISDSLSGSLDNGFRIRRYTHEGVFVSEHTISTTSFLTHGAFSDGNCLYFVQWIPGNAAKIYKARITDSPSWAISNSWTINQGDTRAINGCYDAANNRFWLGKLDGGGTVYRYAGPGLDLRDNPNPLYLKMSGTQYDSAVDYTFRVVPYSSAGQSVITDNAAYSPTLPNRSVSLSQDVRHTDYELGEMAKHEARAVLDKRSLALDVTDLEIATWGPETALTRHYDSDTTDATFFAPGWRFGFERKLTASGSDFNYVDEAGDAHFFDWDGTAGEFHSPLGFYATLSTQAFGHKLAMKDRSHLEFDTQGRLVAEEDKNGNRTTYAWSLDAGGTGDITITAANSQSIVLGVASGKLASATYQAAGKTREVAYTTSAPWDVTYYPDAPEPNLEYTVRYDYDGSSRMGGLSVLDYAPSGEQAAWSFVCTSGDLTSVRKPGYATDNNRRTDLSYSSPVTVSRYGLVEGVLRTVIEQYTINPDGTTASHTVPRVTGQAASSWANEYAPTLEVTSQTSPLSHTEHFTVDLRGNVTSETDPLGRVTACAYDEFDQMVKETRPNDGWTKWTYDAHGNALQEKQILNAQGECAVTEYEYDASGRTTEERAKASEGVWAVTNHSQFADNGEAQRVVRTQDGDGDEIELSPSTSVAQLVATSVVDDLGGALSYTDAAGVVTETNTFDLAGRQLTSEDASGAVVNTVYDILGNEVESWRSHESTTAKADWEETSYDALSQALTEVTRASDGATTSVTTSTFDSLDELVTSDNSQVPGSASTEHDASGQTTKDKEEGAGAAEASSMRIEYDAECREVSMLAPGAEQWDTKYEYSEDDQEDWTENPDGSETDTEYDDAGQMESQTRPTDEGDATTGYSYDLAGRTVSSTAPDGSVTTSEYDLLGHRTSAQIVGRPVSTATCNTLGWVLSETDLDGLLKTKTYDETGRVTHETVGGLTSVRAYDATGREARTENPDGSVLRTAYDAFGRIVRTIHSATNGGPARNVSTTYDAAGRIARTADEVSGLVRTYEYGDEGQVTVTESRGSGNVVTVVDGTGLQRSVDGTLAGAHVTWSAVSTDMANRVDEWAALGQSFEIAYDDAGRPYLQETVKPDGPTMHPASLPPGSSVSGSPYIYDPTTGKKSGEDFYFQHGNSEETSYTYDITGRLKFARTNDNETSYAYDDKSGALVAYSRTGEATVTVTLDYDSAGRLLRAGETLFTYDGLGRRTESGPVARALLASDDFNRANGALTTPWVQALGSYSVSVANNAAQSPAPGTAADLWYRNESVAARADMSVRYRVSQLDSGSGRAFGPIARYSGNNFYFAVFDGANGAHIYKRYNSAYTLISAGNLTNTLGRTLQQGDVVALDVFSTSLSLTVNGVVVNSATDSSITSAGYPGFRCVAATGGLVRVDDFEMHSTSSTMDADTTYSWSGERLTGYSSPTASASYLYDAAGQRVRSVVTEGGLTTTTDYLYEGIRLLGLSAERSDNATWSIDYLYDERGKPCGGVYASSDSATVPFLIVTTDRGDVRSLRSASGLDFAFFAYDAYGNPTGTDSYSATGISASLASTIASRQPLRYASYCFDEHSGLYYCSQRYYDPAVPAFISKDPPRSDGEESAYQYCGGEPIGASDATGLWGPNVHLHWTKDVARDELFNCGNASIIAEEDNKVDASVEKGGHKGQDEYHGWMWGPGWNPRGLRDEYKRKAVTYRKNGEKKRAMRALGHACHIAQDIVAHNRIPTDLDPTGWALTAGMWIRWDGNIEHWSGMDDWGLADPEDRRDTEKGTRDILRGYRKKVGLRHR